MEESERDRIINKFKADLRKDVNEQFYSEDDLITIFDVAGDSCDDYLRLEALMVGARLYPESEELLARRALFYNQLDLRAFSQFMNDHRSLQNPLVKLAALSSLTTSPKEAIPQIEDFVENNSFDDDEIVIQFVQAVHQNGCDQWLADNYQRLREKVDYIPSLNYEIALAAEDSDILQPLAVKCLEELTEIDPYVADYWTLLAFYYDLQDQRDKAQSAIDYALAINPDHLEALKEKMRLLDPEKDTEQLSELLDKVMASDPSDTSIMAMALARAKQTDDPQTGFLLLDNFDPIFEPTPEIIYFAMDLGYTDLERLLRQKLRTSGVNRQEWIRMFDSAIDLGRSDYAETIEKVFYEESGSPLKHGMAYFKILFKNNRYAEACEMFENAEESDTLRMAENLFPAFFRYILSLLRLGREDAAAAAAKTISDAIRQDLIPGINEFERRGAVDFLLALSAESQQQNPDWSTFDPLGFD